MYWIFLKFPTDCMWFQMYFDNSVSVLYFSFLKDFWWLLNLCFNVRLVILIHVLVSSDVLTSAW